jgi:hypothetical protein
MSTFRVLGSSVYGMDLPEPPEHESRSRLRRAGLLFLLWLIVAVGFIAYGIRQHFGG